MSNVSTHRQIPVFLFGAFFVVAALALPALAGPLPVSINTTRIEIAASPGKTASSSFTFWNGTDEFLPVHLEAADIAPQDEEGHVTVGAKIPDGNSLKEWLHPALTDLDVLPRQEYELRFTVDVPATADPGTHYGALLVTTAAVPAGGGASMQVKIGPVILVKVYGAVTEKLSLESFSAPRLAESPPIALAARFKNEGTVHEAPAGSIEVRDMFGTLVATSTLPVRNVLPGVVRKIGASVGNGLWLGRYAILLHATYGDSGQELVSQQYVWVVPWRTQGWKFLIGIGVLAFVIWKRRNFGRAWYFLRTGLPPPQDL
jgi:hypothetical protein